MFDKNKKSILRVGNFDNKCKQHSVLLAEGERIVGVALNYSLSRDGLFDFQFIIAKRG